MIVYLRVAPGFGLAVEARADPSILQHPVIMGGLPHQRGVVREVSVPAQERGIYPGMTLAQAYQQCPDGLFLVPDGARHDAVWQEMLAVLTRFTPVVEPIEPGQAVFDLSGAGRQWEDPWSVDAIAQAIRQQVGIVPWLGVAANRFTAQVASLYAGAEGVAVIPAGQEAAFLAELPISLLPDLDARLALTFQVLGLTTLGRLAALPAGAVKQRFGPEGERLRALARGRDPRPVVIPRAKPAVTARRECDEGTPEEALAVLHALAEECAAELQRRSLAGTLITVTLEWEGRTESPAHAPPSLPAAAPALPPPSSAPEQRLAIPHRIHSMLPQPGAGPPNTPPVRLSSGQQDAPVAARPLPEEQPSLPVTRVTAAARTPIASAPALFERGRQVIVTHWPRSGRPVLRAITLRIEEFEPPRQLGFAALNRLDQSGMLAGLDPTRLLALDRQEQILAARYGDASFRHLTHLDPNGLLAERRFRWSSGLPWHQSAGQGRGKSPGSGTKGRGRKR